VPSVAHLNGSVINNDLGGHKKNPHSFGLRLSLYGWGTASLIAEQSLRYVVRDNTIHDNAIGVDAGYSDRNDLALSGDFSGTFVNNDVSGNCRTLMVVSFTRWNASLFPDQLSSYQYLQDSTYNFTFAGGVELIFADH
jgi:hypothetical protein